jgi:hypothetical protein
MHSERDGAPAGTAEQFGIGRAASASGSYVAPFPGIHGWFWENRSGQTVTLRLATSGHYSSSTEFRDGREYENTPGEAF